MIFNYFYDVVKNFNNFIRPGDERSTINSVFLDAITNDKVLQREWIENGYVKISRRQFTILNNSYIIRSLNNDNNATNRISTDINDYNLKIYAVIHGGDKGRLGEGGLKIAKYINDIDTGDKYVKSKFKKHDPVHIKCISATMLKALNVSKGLKNVAGGQFVVFKSHKNGREYAYILNDFAENDLEMEIRKKLSESQKAKYAQELLNGLAEMHKAGVVHRDIKPENAIIICSSANLADLDFAATEFDRKSGFGTKCYNPPEVIAGKINSFEDLKASDVYQLGVTLYELFHGHHPWYDETKEEEGKLFYNKLPSMTALQYAKTFPEPQIDTIDHLIWEMKHVDPSLRPSAELALKRLNVLLENIKSNPLIDYPELYDEKVPIAKNALLDDKTSDSISNPLIDSPELYQFGSKHLFM